MSWNNTVTCSWCYGKGHNRNGCEERKKYIAQNPDSYEARRAKEHTRTIQNRKCSYCKESGHTKRTCKHLKEDKAKTVAMNKKWRLDALELLKQRGLGVGALVNFEEKSAWGRSQSENVVISDILWDNLTFAVKNGDRPYAFVVRPVKNFSATKYVDFPIDERGVVTRHSVDWGTFASVVSPVTSSSIEASVPTGWLSGDGRKVDEMFTDSKGKTRPRYYVDWVEK